MTAASASAGGDATAVDAAAGDATAAGTAPGDATADWVARATRRSGAPAPSVPRLDPPATLTATAGRGVVVLDWPPVPGAVGYLVHTGPGPDGPWTPLDHGGHDVHAVPHPPYADTSGTPGVGRWYAVAALSDIDRVGAPGPPVRSAGLAAATPADPPPLVTVVVDAASDAGELPRPWQPMTGSEHLSLLLSRDRVGGRPVGEELAAALRLAREAWGAASVRAHAVLGDDLGVYREVAGRPVHDFTGVDEVYDAVVALGLAPVVELSFMPRDLARDPAATVFDYRAVVSPPKDWQRWGDLVRDLVSHLVDRYGRAELRDRWSFEVWNEPNLEVFWTGTPEEYWRLYDVTATAVRDVDPGLRVGGPASAAAGWVDAFLAHVGESGAPCDFVSTHTYGSPPLDLRPVLERHGRAGTPLWWTEWGVGAAHHHEVADGVFAAAFLLRGMRSAMGRIDALSYWVASDHFEELGRPPALLHGGFGHLTVGNLRKPRFHALALLGRLGPRALATAAEGDGAGSLVEHVAARGPDSVQVLAWSSTLDQTKADGDPLLARRLRVRMDNLEPGTWEVHRAWVERGRSDVTAAWGAVRGDAAWPDDAQWAALAVADRLDEQVTAAVEVPADGGAGAGGVVEVEAVLPMPGIHWLELRRR